MKEGIKKSYKHQTWNNKEKLKCCGLKKWTVKDSKIRAPVGEDN